VSEHEEPLLGGWTNDGVVRVGDTVRRPPRFATQLMRDVLVHLERAGFEHAPRWRGFDEQGRDILGFIEGDTFSDCRQIVWRDDQLEASGRLLRRYHDAVAGSELATGAEVVCHGDFGPWNLIWRRELPFAVIDFDNAHPGDRADDLAYALRAHLNAGLVELDAPEQARRGRLFLDAYGSDASVPSLLEREYAAAEERCRRNGWLRELAGLADERRFLATF
jgi:aminoglycoside phosphotransferase (APT) family kinase protein